LITQQGISAISKTELQKLAACQDLFKYESGNPAVLFHNAGM
jgi:hypothetical protein